MRASPTCLAALVALALLGACVKKEPCRPGTVLLTLTFGSAANAVTSVQVTTQVGTGAGTQAQPISRALDRDQLTIEIAFTSYQTDAQLKVSVAADAAGRHFADSASSRLQAGCTRISLTLGTASDAGAETQPADGGDASGAVDGPPADLACGSSAHVCGTACVDNRDPKTCGDRCDACPLPIDADRATCDGVTCGFKCKDGHHRCGNLCADDMSPKTCGSSCSACVPPTGGTATCDGTTCGGMCAADETLCAGNCILKTDTCTFICAVDTHDCNGLCAPDKSLNSCGPSACTACASPMNGTATCDGNACGANCANGYKPCPDATCVPLGGCCTSADCGTPTNGLASCTSGHTCGLACKNGFHVCGGQCVDNRSPAHCGMSCVACTPPQGGTSTCDGQTCGGDCQDQRLCAGACTPTAQPCMNMCPMGAHDCNGQCLSNKSPNSCGMSCDPCSVPDHGTPICDGALCDFTCTMGFKRCGGACIATSSCCVAADCPTITNGAVSCSPNHLCDFTCSMGFHTCNGGCANDHATASCGTSCSACSAPLGGASTCDGTKCGATCPMGQKICANACIPEAMSCMGTCPMGTHDCGGLCLSNTSVNSCGATSCAACPTVANATATCVNGGCGFLCDMGFKLCGGACIDSSLCCDDGDCAGGLCMAGTCCPTGQLSCGGACVDPATDRNHCGGCGKACAGRCSMGVCCGANQTACGGVCYNTNSDATHCGPTCMKCALNLLCLNGKCVL